MGLIDSHAHLTFPELRRRIDDVLDRCDAVGVERIITVGTDVADAREAIALARAYPERIHAAVGIHPHEAGKVADADLDALAELWDDPLVVALGEMGLNYHYDLADRHAQLTVLRQQLELAAGRARPLVIHCRKAFDDVVKLLIDHGFANRRVVFHCFTGSASEALKIEEHGWRLSFTGIVTFPKSTTLQEIAKVYPKKALMIETDAPYLAPVPLRGKHPNEPAHVVHTARFLADLREVSLAALVEQTHGNTASFFDLPAPQDRAMHSSPAGTA